MSEILKARWDGTGEPYFVLRAQDAIALKALTEWFMEAQLKGTSEETLDSAAKVMQAMHEWKTKKIPD